MIKSPFGSSDISIGVVGLGYVGLPLAVEFGKKFKTIGFDINVERISELSQGFDRTREAQKTDLDLAENLSFTARSNDLAGCNVYIVTVPTPIDKFKRPDLSPLFSASKTVGSFLSKGDVVVFESTVYPGATEDECVPILEMHSGLRLNVDFFVGYSPERINPGDKTHKLTQIKKVTSGSIDSAASFVDDLYGSIIEAGTHKASSIRVAEAAKVIENTQRDLNIALMNELAVIFSKLGIETDDVLAAAGTKWNFLPFSPGLVGGHCIGVDPYYLTHKAQETGYHPDVVLAGRRINDWMSEFAAARMIETLLKSDIHIKGARVLVLGVTFKPDCPDIRNSKVFDLVTRIVDFGVEVECYDPLVDVQDVLVSEKIQMLEHPGGSWDAVILAVEHKELQELVSTSAYASVWPVVRLSKLLGGAIMPLNKKSPNE